jgi:ComF family protein
MKRVFNFLINIFFPEVCIVCRTNTPNHLCPNCSSQLIATASHAPECIKCKVPTAHGNLCDNCLSESSLDELYVSFDYQKAHIHGLIHSFKYQNIRNLAKPLAKVLSETLPDTPNTTTTLLIPTPIHPSKKSIRGYNQAELLAKELSTLQNIPVQLILRKKRPTVSQATLTREQRLTNLSNSFELSTGISANITKIYLIDDVTTTLSTLEESARTLRKHTNVRIIGLVLAHNQDTSQ